LDTPEQPVGLLDVPSDADVRQWLRARADQVSWQEFPEPIATAELAAVADQMLAEAHLSPAFRNWLMVILASNYWREAVAAVPFHRRLLLLPELGSPNGRPGSEHGTRGLERLRPVAESLGYHIVQANQLASVSETIRSGAVDAVLGVSHLRGLEKAVDYVMSWGVPCMAEPLLADAPDRLDLESVEQMIRLPYVPRHAHEAGGYPQIMQAARQLFQAESLDQLLPRDPHTFFRAARASSVTDRAGNVCAAHACPPDAKPNSLEPLTGTARIALDFLSRGGKYFRPFITLATYNALRQEHPHRGNGDLTAGKCSEGAWSEGVKRTAMSIEVFHKASLVHDDIEDNDDFRYGEPSVHKRYGVSTAINVGDYLVGLGYRLVSSSKAELGGETVADLLDCLASAHQRLSEGQGAELLWRDSPDKSLTPSESLKVYALKTAPAFEVAFYSGLRLAGPVREEAEMVRAFSEYLGVAFQILNDLQDWCEDETNKGAPGGDILQGRPTLLWALALQAANADERKQLLAIAETPTSDPTHWRVEQVRQLYQRLGVFQQAAATVRELEQAAEEIVTRLQPNSLSRLFAYLLRAVLQRPRGLSQILQSSGN
jgi:geranylgeranyl diphosphate synthase type II